MPDARRRWTSHHPLTPLVPRTLPEILQSAEHGHWRLRAACLSEAGRIAGTKALVTSILARGLRKVPGLARYLHSPGYQGKYVRGPIGNGLVDRSWPVRVAAALALGDCRSKDQLLALKPLLTGPFRAERIAAATAIVACGGSIPSTGASMLDGSTPSPVAIGDSSSSVDVLEALASVHFAVLSHWTTLTSEPQPAGHTPRQWAEFLAGPRAARGGPTLQAEIDRYDPEGETDYLLAKPFSPINRAQNPRLLRTFAAVCEHLHAPHHARILDLGGGSAWVSEFLARMGYVPITLDASTALLNIGRRRLSRAGLTQRLVASDMSRLPLADDSVDAAIVMDALHHVHDVPGVFREVFRVLRTGGTFVVAEPGEGHAETEKSRGEMSEFGVQEAEIHVFEAFDYAAQAGFDDVRVVPDPAPSLSMTSAQLTAAMSSPASRWMAQNGEVPGYLAPHLLQSIFDHPILVCRKGRRPLDSKTPGVLRSAIESIEMRREGERVSGRTRVQNTGDTMWLAGTGHGNVLLGVQLLAANRRPLNLNLRRVPLAGDVVPGGSVELTWEVMLPDVSGFVLKLDMVDEGVCWFHDVGSEPVYVEV